MNINKLNIAIILYFSLGILIYPQSIKEKTYEIIRAELGKDVEIISSKFNIPSIIKSKVTKEVRQHFYSEVVYIFKIFKKDSILGIGILDNVYGKSMPITFLVLYDIKGNILSTNVIKYREPYGSGVKTKNWNDQFKGRNSKSNYKIGEDIYSISGATISVRSLTKGIRKLTLLYEEIKSILWI